MKASCIWAVTWGLLFVGRLYAEDVPVPPRTADRAALERDFARKMSGVTLVGKFTKDNVKDGSLHDDRYTIARATKLEGDLWIFETRIQYGGKDLTIPLTLDVLWAGDTAVITLTDFGIPQLGTFTSRVLIYGDRYSGTWQHGDVGGHLFGKLEPAPVKPTSPPPSDPKPQ